MNQAARAPVSYGYLPRRGEWLGWDELSLERHSARPSLINALPSRGRSLFVAGMDAGHSGTRQHGTEQLGIDTPIVPRPSVGTPESRVEDCRGTQPTGLPPGPREGAGDWLLSWMGAPAHLHLPPAESRWDMRDVRGYIG